MRQGQINRSTLETQISLDLNIDGSGLYEIDTPIPFLNHMLALFSVHGHFDLNIKATGDIEVEAHHLVEDIGIALGEAFNQALSDKRGIKRYASMYLPMDEALILSVVDISNRSFLVYNMPLTNMMLGNMHTELVEEFFIAFTRKANITLHINMIYGKNNHHIVEGAFKGVAQALRQAIVVNHNDLRIPSSKGII
ncbi:MAG: imidazoleglycerol-phosphate dehydratase HisB [Bacilli bacterium]